MNDASRQTPARAKINAETAKITWRELQRFFAAGKVMQVDAELDLVDVADAMQCDDVERIRGWTVRLQLFPVSDDQARSWTETDARLWAVVVKPWILVQPVNSEAPANRTL